MIWMIEMAGSAIVIDTSIAVRWLLVDPLSEACWKLFSQVIVDGHQITVPALWMCEMTSSLAKAVHFKILSPQDARRSLQQIRELRVVMIAPEPEQNQQALEWALRLDRASAYDCYYLALADTLNCEFWTADRRLYHAGRDQGLDWIHHIEEL